MLSGLPGAALTFVFYAFYEGLLYRVYGRSIKTSPGGQISGGSGAAAFGLYYGLGLRGFRLETHTLRLRGFGLQGCSQLESRQ